MSRALFLLLILLCSALGAPWTAARAATVTVLLSERSAHYLEAARSFEAFLAHAGAAPTKVRVLAIDESGAPADPPWTDSELLVTVGTEAWKRARAQAANVPVIGILLPQSAFEALPCPATLAGARRCTAVFLDQPAARQVALVRAAFASSRRLGVVLGAPGTRLLAELRAQAGLRDLAVAAALIRAPEELFGALQEVLPGSDVYLAEPDALVGSAASARNILISAYRYQRPVLAFSQSYVNAGATLGIYSTPEQLGREAAELAGAALAAPGTELPAPHYPRYFSVQVNQHVARSLGLAIPDAQSLLLRMAEPRP